jgi:hypothetical protein
MNAKIQVGIEDIKSIAIRKRMELDGIASATLLAELEHPEHGDADYRIQVWEIDGPVWVIETNGRPVWDQEQPAFDDLLSEYGVDLGSLS